jgi:hypothetical protein
MEKSSISEIKELSLMIRRGWEIVRYEIQGEKVIFHLVKELGKFNWSEDPELKRKYGGDCANDE